MKTLKRVLVFSLIYAVGLQPTVAQMENANKPAPDVVQPGTSVSKPPQLDLTSLSVETIPPPIHIVSFTIPPPFGSHNDLQSIVDKRAVSIKAPASRVRVERLVETDVKAASEAVRDTNDLPSAGQHAAAETQFRVLTREETIKSSVSTDAVPELPASLSATLRRKLARLKPLWESAKVDVPSTRAAGTEVPQVQVAKAEAEPVKSGFTQVFKDPERNRTFWRYMLARIVFMIVFEMYIVGQPYLISSFTKNSLHDHKDSRTATEETVKALIRQNRSLWRIAHWTSQAISYITIPYFTRKAEEGRPWLVRSFLYRALAFAPVPLVFFASGILSLFWGMAMLFALAAAQSFFQGISVTMESARYARLIGDPSVTEAERDKALSVSTIIGSAVSIVAPAIAGHISRIRNLFGKPGSGGAVIYGIYAIGLAGTGLILSTIRMFKGNKKSATTEPVGEKDKAKDPANPKEFARTLWTSLKDGIKLVWQNRFLRMTAFLALINSLFSDPLIFNVLPEYVENIMQAHPFVSHLLQVPGLGWFMKGLTSTPLGYFSFLNVLSNVGGIVGALLMKPARKLLNKLGYRSEESALFPLSLLALLEIPLFWVMMSWHSFAGKLILYGLQAVVTYFAGQSSSGLENKAEGTFKDEDIGKVLAAKSFVSILAAIVSTVVYGFVLKNIPIKTSMLIAAIAIAVQGTVRLLVPRLGFTKEQLSRQPGPIVEKP